MGNNTLMFKVGIADIKTELDKHKKEIESWVNSNPIKLKVQLEDSSLEQLATKLKAMGATFGENNAEVNKLKQELEALKAILNSIMNGASAKQSPVTNELQVMTKSTETAMTAMNQLSKLIDETAASSNKRFPVLDRVPAKYSQLVFDIENRMTQIGKIMSQGNLPSWLDNGKGRGYINNVLSDYERLLKTAQHFQKEGFIDFHNVIALRDVFRGLESAYGPIIQQAAEYNKKVEQQAADVAKYEQQKIDSIRKAEEKGEKERAAARAKEEKEYEKLWQNGMKEREKAQAQESRTRSQAEAKQAKEAELFTKNSIKNFNLWQESIRRSGVELTTLGIKIRQLEQAEARASQVGVDTSKIHARINALKEEEQILIRIHNGEKGLGTAKDYIKSENYQKQIKLAQEVYTSTNKASAEKERADNREIKNLETKETNLRRYNSLLNDTEGILNRLSKAEIKASSLGLDTSKISAGVNQLNQFVDKVLNMDMRNLGDNGYIRNLIADWNALKKSITEVAKEQERLNNSQEKSNAAVIRSQASEYKGLQKNAQDARKEAEALVAARQRMLQDQAASLSKIMSQGKGKLDTFQYEQMRDALRAIREELRQIETIKQRGGLSTSNLFALGQGSDFSSLINAYMKFISGKHEATDANNKLSQSEQQLVNAIKNSNSYLQGQSQIISDLKMMAMQYLSVWGAQSFINNIIELGGQLEQQRLSIGAILQDTAQANHLFSQIKDLAIKSPFGVQQLDAMSKQLSAYGFQYSELYEWTKRLADISAATGTSVDRLALALGHVRSEGALSGYTLRQFSMGNIPLLQKLSENLGKTKQEIRKMTRNKEIGYEDVLEVLKQLTDEGGMFYEAQETMAQALNAKFKNLRDSFQIMYSEMAEGAPGDFLKGVAEKLTDLSRNWKVLMPMITAGVTGFGLWRGAMIAFNYEAARTGKLMTMNAIATSKYNVAQLRAMVGTAKWTIALRGLGRAFVSLARYIFSPVTLGFAAVEGLIFLWQKHNQEVEKAKDLTKAYGEEAVESEKNIAKQLEKIKPLSDQMDESALKTGIDSMTEAIKNYAINGQTILNKMFDKDAEGRVMSLADKYQYLRGELENTIEVYKELKRVKDAFEYGINASDGGWLDDNVETDLTQYSEAYKKFVDDVTSYNSKYENSIGEAIENAKNSDLAFKEATKNLTSYGEMLAEFWSNPDKYQNAAKFMNDLFGTGAGGEDASNLNESFFGYLNKKNEAMAELDQFINNTETRLKEKGYDFSKELAPEQVGALLKMSKEWLEKHPEWENIYGTIKEKLESRWPIKIVPDASPVEEELPLWMENLQKELDKTGITLTANMSMEQIVDEMKKAYDKAQTTINKLGPIALNAKVNIEGLSDSDIEKFNDPTSFQYNPELYSTLKSLKGANDSKSQLDAASKKRGLKLEGMKKNGSHAADKKSKANQENAKAVREQVRVIKEAADAFEYWRNKVGDKGAWEHVKSEFGDVLTKIGITASNIEDVRTHLNNIPNSKEYKAISDKKVKTEIDKEIAKENDQVIRKDFEKTTEEWASAMSRDIDEITRKWEIFNSVVSDTGDKMLAARISGISPGATPADLKRANVSSAAGVGIDYDRVLGMSDTEIDEYVYTLGLAEEKIKAIQDGLKDWKKAEQDMYKSDIQNYAKWLGSLVDLETKRTKNQEEYNEVVRETMRLLDRGVIDEKEASRRITTAQFDRDKKDWQDTSTYSRLYGNAQMMAEDEFYGAYNKEMANLFDQYKKGEITISEYADKVSNLNKIASEFSTSGFLGIKGGVGAYLSGGYQGLIDYHRNKATDLRKQGKEDEAKEEEKTAESMEKAQQAAEQLTKVFQDLSSGADMVANLFDALGMEGAANAFGDAAGVLGGAASGAQSLSALGPWGMAVGGAIGGLTSIFALSDKNHERRIQELKQEVTKIDNTLNTIKALRERELGYDSGSLRRQMAAMYKSAYYSSSNDEPNSTIRGMREYYGRYSGGNGYSQEYNTLIETRKKYMEMYDEEHEKKKSSSEALEEYKTKIAELDEQIMFFTQDLANELWGIDIQGWADQISDSLWTAFENGEDALEAFHKTAKDIISDVAKRMMTLSLIEPAFKRLQNALFGEYDMNTNTYKGGAIKYDSNGNIMMQESEEDVLKVLGRFFGTGGEMEKNVEAAEMLYKWVEKITGFDLSSDESKSGASSSIKNITESTADLLAAYLNAVRLDVSVIRAIQGQYFPMFLQAITAGNTSLTNIENHTEAIMRSNGIIAQKIESIEKNFTGLKNNAWRLPVG